MTVLCMDYFGAQGADPPDPVGAGHAPGPPWAWSLPVLHHRLRQGVQSKEAHKQPRGPPGHRISALVVIAVDLLKEGGTFMRTSNRARPTQCAPAELWH